MYAFIEGMVDSIEDSNVVIVANGVGYEITCANPFQFQSAINDTVKIYTYHYVREDQQLLFGFKQKEDKTLFAKLLNVSGIGPKSALSILATTSAGHVAAAIEQEDEKFLTSFPGVGKKTARQMILDLKGKVTEWLGDERQSVPNDPNGESVGNNQTSQMLEEAMGALSSLGYSDREIKRILPALKKASCSTVDDFIKKGLSLMMEQ
ncbi:Holliday junction branch migration protein RuvA [Salirhabdus sp. Marseille-P4669]|uniref:Holliday junction branch migration protein RuvA n=1 Tax=Salirhabdus sp. Marseille-P4669 TaxID=2042310 RepID=UPI000C7AF256|nr:Holliday junction branch migration protein RuvA [Salirhabdus sp. Marseille-P4669]